MFGKSDPNLCSRDLKTDKVVKLLKYPMDTNYLKIHVACGNTNLAYLTLEKKDTQDKSVIRFYAKGQAITEINAPALENLFSTIASGWGRPANALDEEIMRNASDILQCYLQVDKECQETLKYVSSCTF